MPKILPKCPEQYNFIKKDCKCTKKIKKKQKRTIKIKKTRKIKKTKDNLEIKQKCTAQKKKLCKSKKKICNVKTGRCIAVKKTKKKQQVDFYNESWATVDNYCPECKKITSKILKKRRAMIDEIYSIYNKYKLVDDTILHPDEWRDPPQSCYKQELIDNLNGYKEDFSYALKESKIIIQEDNLEIKQKCTAQKKKLCKTKKKICNVKTGRCIAKKKTKVKKQKVKKQKVKKPRFMNKKFILSFIEKIKIKKNKPKVKKPKVTIQKENLQNQQTSYMNEINKLTSYTPQINENILTLQKLSPHKSIFKRDCLKYTLCHHNKTYPAFSKEATKILLENLNTNRYVISKNVVSPKQYSANCWFNSMFMVFFISDKGRKFTSYMRKSMITGLYPNNKKIPKTFAKQLWEFNLMIDASIVGRKDPSKLYNLLNTNTFIEYFYKYFKKNYLTQHTKSHKSFKIILDGLIKKGLAGNVLSFFINLFNSLHDSTDKNQQEHLKILKLGSDFPGWHSIEFEDAKLLPYSNIVKFEKKYKKLHPKKKRILDINKQKDMVILSFLPDRSKKILKNKQFYITNKKRGLKYHYVLDSIAIIDEARAHFMAFVTINDEEFAFDGDTLGRMIPFKWKNKINKKGVLKSHKLLEKNYLYSEPIPDDPWPNAKFNFRNGFHHMFYYLDRIEKI